MLRLTDVEEPVGAFHLRDLGDVGEPAMWVPRLPEKPVLVLGSRQDPHAVDREACARRGVEVVRRRSGGGAVLVGENQLIWFDVLLTRDHPGWDDDVRQSFMWLSEQLAYVLRTFGIEPVIHRGPMRNTAWSDLVCFGGLGPGEITVDGKKLVGISQRRTRNVARYQVAILRRWQPAELLALFPLGSAASDEAEHALRGAATITEVEPNALLEAAAGALEATRQTSEPD